MYTCVLIKRKRDNCMCLLVWNACRDLLSLQLLFKVFVLLCICLFVYVCLFFFQIRLSVFVYEAGSRTNIPNYCLYTCTCSYAYISIVGVVSGEG